MFCSDKIQGDCCESVGATFIMSFDKIWIPVCQGDGRKRSNIGRTKDTFEVIKILKVSKAQREIFVSGKFDMDAKFCITSSFGTYDGTDT